MITIITFRKLALSFPETTEEPHFDKTSFRVKQKIFATYDAANNKACLKLSVADQDVFSISDPENIFPVENKWGLQGWTFVELCKVNKSIFKDALQAAYCEVAPKKLADKVQK